MSLRDEEPCGLEWELVSCHHPTGWNQSDRNGSMTMTLARSPPIHESIMVAGVQFAVELTYRDFLLYKGVIRRINVGNIDVQADSSLRGRASFGA